MKIVTAKVTVLVSVIYLTSNQLHSQHVSRFAALTDVLLILTWQTPALIFYQELNSTSWDFSSRRLDSTRGPAIGLVNFLVFVFLLKVFCPKCMPVQTRLHYSVQYTWDLKEKLDRMSHWTLSPTGLHNLPREGCSRCVIGQLSKPGLLFNWEQVLY